MVMVRHAIHYTPPPHPRPPRRSVLFFTNSNLVTLAYIQQELLNIRQSNGQTFSLNQKVLELLVGGTET